jgi:hypothetical protein
LRRPSHRLRRRLVALAILALVAGGIAAAAVLLPGGHRLDRGPTSPPPPQAAPAAQHRLRPMHLTATEIDGLRTTIALFISTSVERHHPEQSWPIVHPILRQGLTRRQWSTGNIPVVPYPAAGVDLFTIQSAVAGKVLAEVLLEPPPRTNYVRKTFQIELRRAPRALHGWLVSAWVPEGVSDSQIQKEAASAPPVASHEPHFSGVWLLALAGLLGGGLVLLPVGYFAREAYQNHRAKVEFRRLREESDELRR